MGRTYSLAIGVGEARDPRVIFYLLRMFAGDVSLEVVVVVVG